MKESVVWTGSCPSQPPRTIRAVGRSPEPDVGAFVWLVICAGGSPRVDRTVRGRNNANCATRRSITCAATTIPRGIPAVNDRPVNARGPTELRKIIHAVRMVSVNRRGNRPPTLADIAARAGTTVPTVSKVLNGRSDVSAATRNRVMELVAETGYRRRGGPTARPAGDRLIDLVLTSV